MKKTTAQVFSLKFAHSFPVNICFAENLQAMPANIYLSTTKILEKVNNKNTRKSQQQKH